MKPGVIQFALRRAANQAPAWESFILVRHQ